MTQRSVEYIHFQTYYICYVVLCSLSSLTCETNNEQENNTYLAIVKQVKFNQKKLSWYKHYLHFKKKKKSQLAHFYLLNLTPPQLLFSRGIMKCPLFAHLRILADAVHDHLGIVQLLITDTDVSYYFFVCCVAVSGWTNSTV